MDGVIRTGLVYVGGYAKKIRRVVNAVFKGKFDPKYVNDKITELNKNLFRMITEKGYDKGDVMYMEIPYEIENGELRWIYPEIKVRYWKLVSEEKPFVEKILNMDTGYTEKEARQIAEEVDEEVRKMERPKDVEKRKVLKVRAGTSLENYLG